MNTTTRPAAPAPRPPVARPAVEATRRQLFGQAPAPKPAPQPARPAPLARAPSAKDNSAAIPAPAPRPAPAKETSTAAKDTSKHTSTPPAPAVEELAHQVEMLRSDVAALRAQLAELVASRQAQPAAAPAGPLPGMFQDFTATAVRVGVSEITGETTYKAVGHPFSKFGVRIWPEVLPVFLNRLEVDDPEELSFGDNPLRVPVLVRAEIGERGPKKIIGLAPTAMPHAREEEIPF